MHSPDLSQNRLLCLFWRTPPPSSLLPDFLEGGRNCVPPPGFSSPPDVETEMPRRIAGPIWAIRITMDLDPLTEEVEFRIPNTVCVFHGGGSKTGRFKEKPHYHIYYDAKCEVVKEKVQEMVKQSAIVSKYYKASNGFWSIDTDEKYDLKSYWDYVWRDYPSKKQRLIWWDIPEPQLPIPDLLLESPGNVIAHGPITEYRGREKKTSSSLEKQQKFLRYCKEYYETSTKQPEPGRVIKLLYEYCRENGFTTEACCFVWVNYALSNLQNGDAYKESRRRFAARLESKYF